MHFRLTSIITFAAVLGLGPISVLASHSGSGTGRHISRHHHRGPRAARSSSSISSASSNANLKKSSKRSTGKKDYCAAKGQANLGIAVNNSTQATTSSSAAAPATTTSSTHHHASTPKVQPATPAPATKPAPPADSGSGSGGSIGCGGPFASEVQDDVAFTGGDATYYGIGLGACGWTNEEPDMIAAMAYGMFDSFPDGGNPNNNPVCGQWVEASLPGLGSVQVKIVDRCAGCECGTSLDFSMAAFNKLTNNGQAVGRFHNLSYRFIDAPY